MHPTSAVIPTVKPRKRAELPDTINIDGIDHLITTLPLMDIAAQHERIKAELAEVGAKQLLLRALAAEAKRKFGS